MDKLTCVHILKTFIPAPRPMRLLTAAVAAASLMATAYFLRTGIDPSALHTEAREISADSEGKATQEMIDFSIGALKSASEHSIYAEKGIIDDGNSKVAGRRTDATLSLDKREDAKDLARAVDAMRQLPCTAIKDGDLGRSVFMPGVYCMGSAMLDGEMVLDGLGDPRSTFIFVFDGTFSSADGSVIQVKNGAQSGNVFITAADVAIGNAAELRANLIAAGDVKIGSGALVSEKVLSLGKVEIGEGTVQGGETGSVRICADQQVPVAAENNISNRVFHFTISGAQGAGTAADPVRVAVGTCSKLIPVAAGPQTVTELNTGSLVTPPDGTFTGNFELTGVSNQTPGSPSTLGTVNLSTRIANINVVAGGPEGELSLRFTNRRAITGKLEICKRRAAGPGGANPAGPGPLAGGDTDVQGFFQYTVSGVYAVNQQNPNVKTLQVFTIPAGQCTGPISVTRGDPPPFDTGSPTTLATVSELPRVNSFLESIEVIPASRRTSADILGTIVGVDGSGSPVNISAPGGGYVNVMLVEGQGPGSETLAVFTNRSNPSRVKVCAIAGPGVPINTLMSFTVAGVGALNATHPQASQYGNVSRTFDVRAGDPAQGGTCEFVPGVGANPSSWSQFQTFVNGTPVSIVQNGISPNNVIAQNPGQLRAAQVRVFGSAFASTEVAGYSPNPDLNPTAERVSRASIIARVAQAETEFSSFRFEPALLKVCSRGIGSAEGSNSLFHVSAESPTIGGANPGLMFPPLNQTLMIAAGPESSPEGNCGFVNASSLPGGALNKGSTVRVSQSLGGATYIEAITCPTCGPDSTIVQLNSGSITISGPNGLGQEINTAVFTKRIGPVCRADDGLDSPATSCRPVRFDFDGDGKADPAVISPSGGLWEIAGSANGGQIISRNFGVDGDRPVAADYDGDGITDYAVWRPSNGTWYYQGSTGIYAYHQWGQPGDIPLTGDFNGDGRADFIIFRPSNASWYVRTTNDQFAIFQFGIPSDRPLTGDYDGDRRTDVGVFRNGFWYTLESTRGFQVTQFGQAGDFPLSGDYDGDGKDDNAVYRSGAWYVRSSSTYTATPLGFAGDIPAPADYDGDGKADKAVFRPSSGLWLIRKTALGEAEVQVDLGGPGMVPAAAPYEFFGFVGN